MENIIIQNWLVSNGYFPFTAKKILNFRANSYDLLFACESIFKHRMKYKNLDLDEWPEDQRYYYPHFITCGMRNPETGNFMVRICFGPVFESDDLHTAIFLAVFDFCKNFQK